MLIKEKLKITPKNMGADPKISKIGQPYQKL